MAFLYPGSSLIGYPGILPEKHVRQMGGKNSKNCQNSDNLFFHLLFEENNIVYEKPLKEMPGQDENLLKVASEKLIYFFVTEHGALKNHVSWL